MKHILVILSITVSLVGCGGKAGSEGPDLHKVTGTVTLDGKPIQEGSITLDPTSGGVPAMGGIKDGAFEFEAAPGEYIARFAAMKVTTEKDEYGELITESLISDEYNSNSKETASIKAGSNTLTFEIKGK